MIGRVNVAGRGEGPAPGPAYSVEKWCKVAGLTYSDISDISEQNMRILMSKHASVDYFMAWYSADNAMLDMFTVIEFAMKWIGLNDYICDKLLAISDAKSRLLASPYWEYILKDKVPIMTANDAPYGTVSGSNRYESSFDFYKAFDGNDSTVWRGSSNTSYNQSVSGYIEYAFPNPICVKRVKYVVPILGSAKPQTTDILFVGYNGTEEIPLTIASVDGDEYVLNDYVYVTKLRVTVTQKNLDTSARVMPAISTLQFYGRSLNVSVPTMTSNTQPYGEVISNGTPYAPSSSEPQLPYEAFDNKTTTGTWLYTTDGTKPYVGYDFKKEIVLKYASILANGGSSESLPHTSRFETSLDGVTWTPFGTDVVRTNTPNATDIRINAEGVKCRYVRNVVVDTPTVSGKTRTLAILKMNFFGVDYSDRTERTYLYDHGVELVPWGSGTYALYNSPPNNVWGESVHFEKRADDMVSSQLTDVIRNSSAMANDTQIDFTPYNTLKARLKYRGFDGGDVSINVSNVNESAYVLIGTWKYDDGNDYARMVITKDVGYAFHSAYKIAENQFTYYPHDTASRVYIEEVWLE